MTDSALLTLRQRQKIDVSGLDELSEWRIRLVLECRDADAIPKVANAGTIVEVDGLRCQVMHNGTVIAEGSYYPEFMIDLIRLSRGVHEPQEELCFWKIVQTIRPGGLMIEAGSYWGYYSLWFWNTVPFAVCHLIELDTSFMEIGMRNFSLNNASGIFTNAGFGKPDLTPWNTEISGNYVRTAPTGQIFGPRPSPAPALYRNIPLITLDQYATDNGIDTVDILHADIQGEELAMLGGAEMLFEEGRVAWVLLSTHKDDDFHGRCLERVRQLGLAVVAEHNLTDSFSGDGLIVAKRPDVAGPDSIKLSARSRMM